MKITVCCSHKNTLKKLRGLSPQANYTERPPLVGEVSVNFFADRGCRVVSAMDPHGRILGFLDRSGFYFFQVAPQSYSTRLSGPRSRHYFSENLVAPGIEPGISGSVARNSDHYTTEAVHKNTYMYYMLDNGSVKTAYRPE
jgi:hypothetical protein